MGLELPGDEELVALCETAAQVNALCNLLRDGVSGARRGVDAEGRAFFEYDTELELDPPFILPEE